MLKRIFVAGLLASAVTVSAPAAAGSNTAEHIAAEVILHGLLGVRHDHYISRHDRIARAEQRRYRERLLRQERLAARQEREYRRRMHALREQRHSDRDARRGHHRGHHGSYSSYYDRRHDGRRDGYRDGRRSRRDGRYDAVRVETHVGRSDDDRRDRGGRNSR